MEGHDRPARERWAGLDGLLEVRAALHAWARGDPRIHAAVAIGSTERVDRPHDAWADLDLLFVVDDPNAWSADLRWVEAIGPSWIRLVNASPLPGIQVVQVMFAGGYDADLIPISPDQVAVFETPEVASEVFGHGATVLIDRSGAFSNLIDATGAFPTATIQPVGPPTSAEFERTVNVFLYQAVWATKRLRRGERWRAHDDVDDYMRDLMLRMIEWHALARRVDGVMPESRQLERWAPPDVQADLPATFAAYDDGSIAEALVRSRALFRRLAREVAERWSFTYPEAADAEIEAWVRDRLADRDPA